jgi:hypothetical protein
VLGSSDLIELVRREDLEGERLDGDFARVFRGASESVFTFSGSAWVFLLGLGVRSRLRSGDRGRVFRLFLPSSDRPLLEKARLLRGLVSSSDRPMDRERRSLSAGFLRSEEVRLVSSPDRAMDRERRALSAVFLLLLVPLNNFDAIRSLFSSSTRLSKIVLSRFVSSERSDGSSRIEDERLVEVFVFSFSSGSLVRWRAFIGDLLSVVFRGLDSKLGLPGDSNVSFLSVALRGLDNGMKLDNETLSFSRGVGLENGSTLHSKLRFVSLLGLSGDSNVSFLSVAFRGLDNGMKLDKETLSFSRGVGLENGATLHSKLRFVSLLGLSGDSNVSFLIAAFRGLDNGLKLGNEALAFSRRRGLENGSTLHSELRLVSLLGLSGDSNVSFLSVAFRGLDNGLKLGNDTLSFCRRRGLVNWPAQLSKLVFVSLVTDPAGEDK